MRSADDESAHEASQTGHTGRYAEVADPTQRNPGALVEGNRVTTARDME